MCGRYIYDRDPNFEPNYLGAPSGYAVGEYLRSLGPVELAARPNISPTQDVPAIVFDAAARKPAVRMLRWGLIPYWAKDTKIAAKLINARAETLSEKPSFRAAFQRRRCLLLATGYYEWQVIAGQKRKTKWMFTLRTRAPFCMAGLFERWKSPEGQSIESCTIITTASNEVAAPIHDRMPVILPAKLYDSWIDPGETNASKFKDWLQPLTAGELVATAEV